MHYRASICEQLGGDSTGGKNIYTLYRRIVEILVVWKIFSKMYVFIGHYFAMKCCRKARKIESSLWGNWKRKNQWVQLRVLTTTMWKQLEHSRKSKKIQNFTSYFDFDSKFEYKIEVPVQHLNSKFRFKIWIHNLSSKFEFGVENFNSKLKFKVKFKT